VKSYTATDPPTAWGGVTTGAWIQVGRAEPTRGVSPVRRRLDGLQDERRKRLALSHVCGGPAVVKLRFVKGLRALPPVLPRWMTVSIE